MFVEYKFVVFNNIFSINVYKNKVQMATKILAISRILIESIIMYGCRVYVCRFESVKLLKSYDTITKCLCILKVSISTFCYNVNNFIVA